MIDLDKISLLEWCLGGGLLVFFCLTWWRLLRSTHRTINREISGFDLHSFKNRG